MDDFKTEMLLFQPKPIDVQVVTHHMQRYAVWFGGSMLASTVRKGCEYNLPLLACGRLLISVFLSLAAGVL